MNYQKRYFGNRYYGLGQSKRFVFKHVCSGCGKPLRRGRRNRLGFLCNKCAPRFEGMLASERESACYSCFYYDECVARVQLGIWLRCETPDVADLERLRLIGGLDDERIRTELETALAGSGDREILETAVSQSAQALYQGDSTWIERETALAL